MPSLFELRQQVSTGKTQQKSQLASAGYLEVRGLCDEMITDTRSRLTPSQMVERKLQAIASAGVSASQSESPRSVMPLAAAE